MKKWFIGLVLITSNAFAGSISLDLRTDMKSLDYDSAANAAANSDYYKFILNTGRVDFKGDLNPEISYRLRLRFDKDTASGSAYNSNENATNALDYIYVTHKISDSFSLTMGKQSSDIGGIEGNTPSADIYLLSTSYSGFGSSDVFAAGDKFAVGANNYSFRGTKADLYLAGLKFTQKFSDTQNISVGVYNNEGVQTSQNKSMMGVVYNGYFDDKAFRLLLSYHAAGANRLNTTTSFYSDKDSSTYAAAGLGYKMDAWDFTFDYLLNTIKGNDSTASADYTFTNSVMIVNIRYAMENWTPILRYFQSDDKLEITTTSANKGMHSGMGLAFEYKPNKESNFRYHVAANSYTYKPDSGTTLAAVEALAGIRIMADFLK